MNEHAAREVVLVRAIEIADGQFEILSADDRKNASRSAKELAQWQAAQGRTEATTDDFLQQRARQILKRVAARFPAISRFLQWPEGLNQFWLWLPAAGLLAGLLMDRISDPHRVDLLSAPLLLIIGWNLLVYAAMLVWPWLPSAPLTGIKTGISQLLSLGQARLPRKLPPVLSSALGAFMREWLALSRQLTQARLARTLHLSAALFAVGAILSLVARGYFSQYSAGWESTFLSASQVHALLSALFTPAELVFQLQGFSLAEIEALRFSPLQVPSGLGGARWVTLYAATMLLLVVLPRLLLAGVAIFRVKKLTENFPLDLEQPYFRKLTQAPGSAPGTLRVLPYSFAIDEAREQGLKAVARLLLGEQARLLLLPSMAYGDEPQLALQDFRPNDGDVTLTAVLFNLAATPEAENQGALLDYLVRESARGIAVFLDESSYLERVGRQSGGALRMTERIALWQQFCSFHKAPATVVNLLKPEAHALDAGLSLSAAP